MKSFEQWIAEQTPVAPTMAQPQVEETPQQPTPSPQQSQLEDNIRSTVIKEFEQMLQKAAGMSRTGYLGLLELMLSRMSEVSGIPQSQFNQLLNRARQNKLQGMNQY